MLRRLHRLVLWPILWWAGDVEEQDPQQQTAWQRGKSDAIKAAKDGRTFGLVSTVTTCAAPTIVGFLTRQLPTGWQAALIVAAGAGGYLLVPTLWAVGGAITAPTKQRNDLRGLVRPRQPEFVKTYAYVAGALGASRIQLPHDVQTNDEFATFGVLLSFTVDVTNQTTDRPTSVSFELLLPNGCRVRDDVWSDWVATYDLTPVDHGPIDLAPGTTRRLKLCFQVRSWDLGLGDNATFLECVEAVKVAYVLVLDHVSNQWALVPRGSYPANIEAKPGWSPPVMPPAQWPPAA